MRSGTRNIYLAVILAVAVIIPVFLLFGVGLPADAQYNRLFNSKMTMLYDQATFEGMLTQLDSLWRQMNTTFAGYNFEETFNTPWYWDRTYDNSLKADEDYFRQLRTRFTEAITEKAAILAGNRTIIGPYSQWYQTTLDSLRSEMKREGGITWAIKGTWYLNYAPLAYWSIGIDAATWVFSAILFLFVVTRSTYEDDREEERRLNERRIPSARVY